MGFPLLAVSVTPPVFVPRAGWLAILPKAKEQKETKKSKRKKSREKVQQLKAVPQPL